jgi:uncharacterized membrane protein
MRHAPRLALAALLALAAGCGASNPSDPDAGGTTGGGQSNPQCVPVTAPTDCPAPTPHYADVQPLLQQRCVICHSEAPGGPWPLTDYEHVADWGDAIRSDLLDCTMPPPDAGPMPDEEKLAILGWIRCGTPQ